PLLDARFRIFPSHALQEVLDGPFSTIGCSEFGRHSSRPAANEDDGTAHGPTPPPSVVSCSVRQIDEIKTRNFSIGPPPIPPHRFGLRKSSTKSWAASRECAGTKI